LRLEQIKQQMEALEQSISNHTKKNEPVPQGLKDSLAFLRAQHDNLELWQNSIAPQPFPGGITFVDPSGRAIYRVELPNGEQAPSISLECKELLGPSSLECKEPSSPECKETSPESQEEEDRVGPHFPEIKACKIRIPAKPVRVHGKPNVTVALLDPPKGSKKPRKPKSSVVPQAPVAERRSLRKAPASHVIERMVNGNLIVNEPNGAVRINGNLYVSEAFRWLIDPNGNKFFVYIPVSVWNKRAQAWAMRVLFDVPGKHTTIYGLPGDSCFQKVGNIQALVDSTLSRLWYVQVSRVSSC
jgi:hypothetical protein